MPCDACCMRTVCSCGLNAGRSGYHAMLSWRSLWLSVPFVSVGPSAGMGWTFLGA
jgi:hypothetical protein